MRKRWILALICCMALWGMLALPEKVSAAGSVPMYRVYNPNSGEHFYTANSYERDHLVRLGWNGEGIGWYAPSSGVPVYRVYNPNAGDHHYTMNKNEKNWLVSLGWKDEGIGWYSDPGQTVKVYRLYNPNAVAGAHHYTTNYAEYIWLAGKGWRQEGLCWYGTAAPAAPAAPAQKADGDLAAPSVSGALRVEGSKLVGSNGKTVQLRGISTHGLAWFPQYVDETAFSQFRKEWKANVIRLAMYTEEYGGYCSGGNRENLKKLIDNGVRYATNQDMYVIIDWHILSDGNPLTHKEEAKQFFSEISRKYASAKNILYEICNEPNNGTTWSQIKSYAQEVIPVIRANDSDAVILVGTPTWSQEVDKPASDPLRFGNIMYTFHFYAGTHKEDLRNRVRTAAEKGTPIFVSEFGICDASGNGNIDEAEANRWIAELDRLNISYVNWSLANKNESASMLKPSCSKTHGFTTDDLAQSGQWLYRTLTSHVK